MTFTTHTEADHIDVSIPGEPVSFCEADYCTYSYFHTSYPGEPAAAVFHIRTYPRGRHVTGLVSAFMNNEGEIITTHVVGYSKLKERLETIEARSEGAATETRKAISAIERYLGIEPGSDISVGGVDSNQEIGILSR